MPIQEENIVFVESSVMDDVPEGGGALTGTVIPDGVMNNVFPDVSDLDRAYGRLRLRKIGLAVRTLSTDLYGGAKSIISALPDDASLNYALFTTNDAFDTRTDAASRVAAYLYKGPLWNGALYENHIIGMRAISVIQRVDTLLPAIGKTLCLVQDEGLSGEKEQYVRVLDVTVTESMFTDNQGDYLRWIVRLDLSDTLRFNFSGHTVNRTDTYNYTGKTRVRDTLVADATRYFGTHRLSADAHIGDLTVRAASLFTQLVPSAQTETPLVNQPLTATKIPMLASRANAVGYSAVGTVVAPNGRFYLETGALPGSISFSFYTITVTDDGNGNALYNGQVIGIWDYPLGKCTFNASAPNAAGTAGVSYIPATAAPQQAHTRAVTVTVENRRLNWIETLTPIPAPRTLTVSFMSQGNWYQLSETGLGQITGSDATVGAGNLSFITGDAPVTLGALPDVGSKILYTWGSGAHTAIHVGDSALDTRLLVRHSVGEAIEPGSLVITWLQNAVTKTATVATSGIVSGHCTGYVSHIVGDLRLEFTTPPDAGSQIGLTYNRVTQTEVTFTGVAAPGGLATLALGAAVEPGSVEARWSTDSTVKYDGNIFVATLAFEGVAWRLFNNDFGLATETGAARRYNWASADNAAGVIGGASGSVNYATGELVLPVLPEVSQSVWQASTWQVLAGTSTTHAFTSGVVIVTYTPAGAAPTAVSTTIPLPPLQIRLLPPLVDEALVPGGIRFRWNGETYIDRAGVLYRAVSPATGSGVVAGSVDYATSIATLTSYVSGGGAVTIDALLGRYGDWTATDACFRTAAAPLKSESLTVTATTEDGLQITGATDPDGVISGTWMRGDFNDTFGMGALEFGQMSGPDWVPRTVDPASIRYNAVAYKYVPLDADILGIDAVRLPTDGRVPIYRDGDLVFVFHPVTNAPATPALNGGSGQYELSCGRTRIAWAHIIDNNGAAVTTGYTLDRASGILSWPNLDDVATPVTVTHVVGDLRMVVDAQITGDLTLARALSHDFPANASLVASCLIHGDRRARVSATWDQTSWDNTWKDYLVGTAATATLNLIDYPIRVTNEGCDTDRWVLRWLSTSTVELISEHRGLVWSGAYASGSADIAPINPRTRDANGQNGTPYLVIPAAANGGGFAAGNIVRINTVGAIADLWIANSIQQSDAPDGDGVTGCEIYALGNIDRP